MAQGADETEGAGGPGRTFYLVLGGVALAGAAFLFFARGGGPEPVGPLSQAEIEVEADSGAYAAAVGPEDAPVTLIEFADYQCSHCARFASLPGPALKRDYVQTGQVRMLLYDFPLSRRTNAVPAALAARCAGDQGSYWEMHRLLFSNQADWARDQSPEDKFADYADRIGLDRGQFDQCYSEREFIEEIMASRAYGTRLGVSGTPAIYVNGQKTDGYSYEAVQQVIETELEASGSAASSGQTASAGAGGGDG